MARKISEYRAGRKECRSSPRFDVIMNYGKRGRDRERERVEFEWAGVEADGGPDNAAGVIKGLSRVNSSKFGRRGVFGSGRAGRL